MQISRRTWPVARLMIDPRIRGVARATVRRVLPSPVRRIITARLRRVTPPTSRRAARPALLSVVMPVYNVEEFVAEAVQSVLDQTHRRLELILVDDGSTDASGRICDELAERDARISVIHQDNGGLGNARNEGAKRATGSFITFMDSDDLLPPDAYQRLIGSLRSTGSDFATGNVERFTATRSWRAWNQEASHRHDQRAIRLEDCPELIYDTQAWNKVFRKSFYDQTGVQWVEGRLYEDMVPVLKAFLDAAKVDVLTAVTYRWRQRDQGNSITQRRQDLDNLLDKVEMLDIGLRMLVERGHPRLLELFHHKAFDGDLFAYHGHLRTGDDEFDAAFEDAVCRLWPRHLPDSLDAMWFERRVFYAALVLYGLDQAQWFWEWARENRFKLPTLVRDGVVSVDLRRIDERLPFLPTHVWRLVRETQVNCTVTDIRWVEGRLCLGGWAYIPHDEHPEDQQLELVAVGPDGQRTALDVVRCASPYATRYAASAIRSHENTGFRAWLDPEQLGQDVGKFLFEITIRRGTLVRTAELHKVWRGGSVLGVAGRPLSNWRRLTLIDRTGDPLGVRVTDAPVWARGVSLADRRLAVDVATAPDVEVVAAWLKHDSSGARREMAVAAHGGGCRLEGVLPDPEWRGWVTRHLVAQLADGREVNVDMAADLAPQLSGDTGDLLVMQSRAGHLTVVDRPRVVEVTDIAILPDKRFRLRGTAAVGVELEFGHGPLKVGPTAWAAATRDGGTFEVVLDVSTTDRHGRRRPLKDDTYVIKVRDVVAPGERRQYTDWHLRATLPCAVTAPVRSEQADVNLQINLTRWRELRFWSEPPIAHHERSRYWQTRFAEEARHAGSMGQVEDAAFFTTYFGFEASDSPRAIHAELRRRGSRMTLYWGVVDHSVDVPEGAVPVIKHTREWYRAIAVSRYLVNNVGAIYAGYERLPHQTDVQTWHGTPLKIVGRSLLVEQHRPTLALEREGQEWDYLVSQSPFYSDVIAREFASDATILETGYPRNDELFAATPGDIADIRADLGIAADAKVLLYAPTWRDNVKSGWSAPLFDELDFGALATHLGEEWVVLVRGHGFNARANDKPRHGTGVIDVTQHPSINELYLASDALVTDYSSVMFDYAVTGKPILFFVPDYTAYLATRPTYVELKEVAPGPVTFSQDELHEQLDHLDDFGRQFGQAYEEFRRRFVPWDDGRAASRVVDLVFGADPLS